MLHRDGICITVPEMQKIVKDYAVESYHVTMMENGGCILRFGDDDPMVLLHQKELEIETLKAQVRFLMTMAYGIDYSRAEELVK